MSEGRERRHKTLAVVVAVVVVVVVIAEEKEDVAAAESGLPRERRRRAAPEESVAEGRRERGSACARATRDPRNANRDDCRRWDRGEEKRERKYSLNVRCICFQPLYFAEEQSCAKFP